MIMSPMNESPKEPISNNTRCMKVKVISCSPKRQPLM